MTLEQSHRIAVVDDHFLFASSLANLVNSYPEFNVVCKARNGAELQSELEKLVLLPEIVLLDVNMPVMNGHETLLWLTEAHPGVKVLMLSMEDSEDVILKMIRCGAKGYFLKDIHPNDLHIALKEVISKGYYYSQNVASTMVNSMTIDAANEKAALKENELIFLKLACTEMTYKEIAEQMKLSPKTIDGYRQDLFVKLKVRNRVGLVIYALKHKIVEL